MVNVVHVRHKLNRRAPSIQPQQTGVQMAREYYDLTVNVNVRGFPMANVFKFFIDDPSVSNEFEVAASIINALPVGAGPTAWMFRYRSLISSQCYVSNILCRRATNGGGNTAEAVLQEDSLPGLATGYVSATQTAGVVIWLNDDVPDKTGRNFIPGTSVDDLDSSRFTADYQTRMTDFIARHIAGFNVSAGTVLPCTWDRTNDIGYQILNGYLSPKVGTMRRRETRL